MTLWSRNNCTDSSCWENQNMPSVPFTYQVGVKEHVFTQAELGGVAVTAIAGTLSLLAILLLLFYTIYMSILRPHLRQRRRNSLATMRTYATDKSSHPLLPRSGSDSFWRKQIGVLFICLLISDFIQAIAGVTQLHWLAAGKIDDNATCQFQGAVLVLGDVGTAVWNTLIAIVTFIHLVLKSDPGSWMITSMVLGGWMLTIVLNIVGPILIATNNIQWFGIAGGWCFITSDHILPRILVHYVPIFLSATIILVLYTLIFLHLRGYLLYSTKKRFGWTWKPNHGARSEYVKSASNAMLYYPIAYLVLIVPDSAARLAAARGKTAPDGWWYFGMTLMFSMGFCNVIIYSMTRNVLGLERKPAPRRQHSNFSLFGPNSPPPPTPFYSPSPFINSPLLQTPTPRSGGTFGSPSPKRIMDFSSSNDNNNYFTSNPTFPPEKQRMNRNPSGDLTHSSSPSMDVFQVTPPTPFTPPSLPQPSMPNNSRPSSMSESTPIFCPLPAKTRMDLTASCVLTSVPPADTDVVHASSPPPFTPPSPPPAARPSHSRSNSEAIPLIRALPVPLRGTTTPIPSRSQSPLPSRSASPLPPPAPLPLEPIPAIPVTLAPAPAQRTLPTMPPTKAPTGYTLPSGRVIPIPPIPKTPPSTASSSSSRFSTASSPTTPRSSTSGGANLSRNGSVYPMSIRTAERLDNEAWGDISNSPATEGRWDSEGFIPIRY